MSFARSMRGESTQPSDGLPSVASTATRSTTSGSSASGPERTLKTIFIAVPSFDWAAVKIGAKTEFRLGTGTNVLDAKLPTPVVLYGDGLSAPESMLAVLEAKWREPLAAISEESLRREGYPDMAHFRRYWMQKTGEPFRPL